jgi:hypothetical protein
MDTLVVMQLADMRRVHPKQDNSRVCNTCGKQVGIYPSGQRMLALKPDMLLLCNRCHVDYMDTLEVLAPGAELEPLESVPGPAAKKR